MTEQIAISDFVAEAIGEPSVTIRNGVPDRDDGRQPRARQYSSVQRLETREAHGRGVAGMGDDHAAGGGLEAHWSPVTAASASALVDLARELGVSAIGRLPRVRSDVDVLMQPGILFWSPPLRPSRSA